MSRLEGAFATPQTEALVDILDEIRQAEIERAADTRTLKEGQTRLTDAMANLANRMDELADAQKETQKDIQTLADAQKETQKDIQTLTKQLGETNSTLGGLGQSMAYALENEAYRMLPALLAEKYGIELHERLIRTEIEGEEINIFGRGQQNGQEILVVGEMKLSLDGRRQSRQGQKTFFEQLQAKEEAVRKGHPDEEIVLLAITHYARTNVRKEAEEAGIIVVQSFEW